MYACHVRSTFSVVLVQLKGGVVLPETCPAQNEWRVGLRAVHSLRVWFTDNSHVQSQSIHQLLIGMTYVAATVAVKPTYSGCMCNTGLFSGKLWYVCMYMYECTLYVQEEVDGELWTLWPFQRWESLLNHVIVPYLFLCILDIYIIYLCFPKW